MCCYQTNKNTRPQTITEGRARESEGRARPPLSDDETGSLHSSLRALSHNRCLHGSAALHG